MSEYNPTHPQTIQATAVVLGCSQELDGKTLLLKIPHHTLCSQNMEKSSPY